MSRIGFCEKIQKYTDVASWKGEVQFCVPRVPCPFYYDGVGKHNSVEGKTSEGYNVLLVDGCEVRENPPVEK